MSTGRESVLTPTQRSACLEEARRLFNRGAFWEAHEALETVWRSVRDPAERRVWQGLIQAAAALLHRSRQNAHGVAVVGAAAMEKLSSRQHPRVEFETVAFGAALQRALEEQAPAPTLYYIGGAQHEH